MLQRFPHDRHVRDVVGAGHDIAELRPGIIPIGLEEPIPHVMVVEYIHRPASLLCLPRIGLRSLQIRSRQPSQYCFHLSYRVVTGDLTGGRK